MFNVEFIQELFEPSSIELGTIVYDDGSRKAIMAYNRLPDERLHLGLSDVGHGLGLYPFGKIIHCDEEKLPLQGCHWERPQDVNFSLCKGPRRNQRGELGGGQVLSWGTSLTRVTSPHIFHDIFLDY